MFHKNRVWCVRPEADSPVRSPQILADWLVGRSWCSCSGFELGNYLFLNDQTSPDGAGEWGIVRKDTLTQIESITFGWCNRADSEDYIQRILAGAFDNDNYGSVRPEQIQTPQQHGRCGHCA